MSEDQQADQGETQQSVTSDGDIVFLEQADDHLARGEVERALRIYLAAVDADAANFYVWYRVATILGRLGDTEAAAQALSSIAPSLARGRELLLSLAAIKELSVYDGAAARASLDRVATLMQRRTKGARGTSLPPPLPNREGLTVPRDVAEAELRVLRELGVDRCLELLTRPTADKPATDASGENEDPYHPLLSDLSADDLWHVVQLMELRSVGQDERLIEQGADGTALFLMVRGSVEVARVGSDGNELILATLHAGAFFGEMALLTESPRTASVRAMMPCTVFVLEREALEGLAERSASFASVLGSYTRTRLLRNLMATSAMFSKLDLPRRERLMALFDSRLLAPGEKAVVEGEPSEQLFVVLSGAVVVTRQEDGEPMAVAELGPGQLFGEISLIQRRPATATVAALTKTVLLVLSRQRFNAHVNEFPEVLSHVYQLANERERAIHDLEDTEAVAVDEDSLLI